MKISEILAKYETDKVTGHCYGESYDELFSRFDRNAPLVILEIGTQKGGSLLAWKEFFPNATVTGVDIVDVVKPDYRKENINYAVTDIKNFEPTGLYDIVIDDGSHDMNDVLIAVDKLYPKLKEGGVMVIEDVQSPMSWVYNIQNRVVKKLETIDLRHIKGNYDDFLIVINK